MKIKTADLIGPALDWAVGVAENMPIHVSKQTKFPTFNKVLCRMGDDDSTDFRAYTPSTSWSQGGPIIEREGISLLYLYVTDDPFRWAATQKPTIKNVKPDSVYGPTPLIAAMRCVVAANLGDEVDVPKDLVT